MNKMQNIGFKTIIISDLFKYSFLLGLTVMLSGCLGGMKVRDTHYFSIHSLDGCNTNYYKMDVKANTFFSKAEYYSGWYPKEAVDQLFGKVLAQSDLDYIITQRELSELTNDNILQLENSWLTAVNGFQSDSALQRINNARRQILAYPSFASMSKPFKDAIGMEYNPALERVVRHIDQKQVLFLSANPDEIIQEINNFAQSTETAVQLEKIANSYNAEYKRKAKLANEFAFMDSVRISALIIQIDSTLSVLDRIQERTVVQSQIRTLINNVNERD